MMRRQTKKATLRVAEVAVEAEVGQALYSCLEFGGLFCRRSFGQKLDEVFLPT